MRERTPQRNTKQNGRWQDGRGRWFVYAPTCSRKHINGYALEHIVIAEKILGKPLPPKAQVHHVDGDVSNNANPNLVICEDQFYHKMLHTKLKGMIRCRKCRLFGNYSEMRLRLCGNRNRYYHADCLKTLSSVKIVRDRIIKKCRKCGIYGESFNMKSRRVGDRTRWYHPYCY